MPATAAPHANRAGRNASGQNEVAPAVVPFVSAAHEHTEQFLDFTVTPGASAVQIPVPDVPAYGFIRHIFLQVTATGGTIGAGVLHQDYPFNLFQSISLNDVNGAPIYGPLDGYATLWSNIIGGYAYNSDPRRSPSYVSTINAAFPLRIPVEISHHDGFGSLANQNAAASYKLNLTVNPSTALYTTAPTTVPAFRIRGFLEAWSLPNEVDVVGRRQAQFPPVHGTSQFWSARSGVTVSAGNNSIPLTRVGNLIRNVVFITRNNSGNTPRDDTVFPDPASINWDARTLLSDSQFYRTQVMFERAQLPAPVGTAPGRDTGVFAYQFDHSTDNLGGDDSPALWLPTVQSTRLEVAGSAATAGTVQIITNDIAPAEVIPAERFVETSRTGFHPEIGAYNAAAQ